MTKQEKIQEVFESNYIYADTDGWIRLGRFHWNELGFDTSEIYLNEELDIWRPLSLQGIENNNGWVKIESEEDLPNEEIDYWVVDSYGDCFICKFDTDYKAFKGYFHYDTNGKITHYKPIIKPQLPIY